MNYSRKGVRAKKKALNAKSQKIGRKAALLVLELFLISVMGIGVIGASAGIGMFKGILASTPQITPSQVAPVGAATFVYDCEGNKLDELIAVNSNRIIVTQDKIPENLAHAFVALEDERFYQHNGIDIQGTGPDWREVVAVFAARTAGADDGTDVAALTPDRVDRLKAVFWDMCAITSEVETIPHPDSDPDDDTDDSWTERILHITITAKTAEDMRTEYAFTDYQNRALAELLAELATMDLLLTDLSASQEQARNILRNLPDGLSPERRAVVETACKLVGKVNYFWGGKSRVIGWDSRWGTIQKVWADGSSTTGTYRPYGLDCSGFVDWVFYNISDGAYTIGHGGGAHAQHTYCTAITWAEAQPGDLVFYPEDTHVGIVGGWDEDGNIQIIHCASGQNNVVITGKAGFTSIGRPDYYG